MTSAIFPQQLFSFYTLAEKLKTTLRHSWLSSGRQESVAEHTWMMSLLALVLAPQMQIRLDLTKILKMIILHDLAEAITSDMPVWQGVENKVAKDAAEKAAIAKIFESLDESTRADLMSVWTEYELRESAESRFVKALDTLDVIVQHNTARIETWDDNDYMWQLSPLQDRFFDFDVALRAIKKEIDIWSIEKATQANHLEKLDQTELKKRQQ